MTSDWSILPISELTLFSLTDGGSWIDILEGILIDCYTKTFSALHCFAPCCNFKKCNLSIKQKLTLLWSQKAIKISARLVTNNGSKHISWAVYLPDLDNLSHMKSKTGHWLGSMTSKSKYSTVQMEDRPVFKKLSVKSLS